MDFRLHVTQMSVLITINSLLSNGPGKMDSNFFCYAATVLSPHRNHDGQKWVFFLPHGSLGTHR